VKHTIYSTILALIVAYPNIIIDSTSEYNALTLQYPRLQQEWYTYIVEDCFKYRQHYRIEPSDVCALIQNESNWVASAQHYNYRNDILVSIDYGLCQINSCFGVYTDIKQNIDKGIYEYSLCIEQAKGDKPTANRLYNAGRNNKADNYHNWVYVDAIAKDRRSSQEMLNNYYQIK